MRGRRDEPQVDGAVAHVAETAKPLVLEDGEELRLDQGVDVAYLVQEHGAAVRHLEQAELVAGGSSEGALRVSEQLGLEQLAR